MERQTNGETDIWIAGHMVRQKDRVGEADRWRSRQMEKYTDGEADRWRSRQMEKQTDGEADKWRNRYGRIFRLKGGQMEKRADVETRDKIAKIVLVR